MPAGGGALNVSGSQASIIVTMRSGSARVAAVLAPPAGELEDTVEGLSGDGDEPASGIDPLRVHPAVNAMMARDDTMTGETRQCMGTPFERPTGKRAASSERSICWD